MVTKISRIHSNEQDAMEELEIFHNDYDVEFFLSEDTKISSGHYTDINNMIDDIKDLFDDDVSVDIKVVRYDLYINTYHYTDN